MDSTEQLDAADELTRRFLLGQLIASEQSTFEERLLTDDRLELLVRQAECELADDYIFERLNRAERQLFTQRFLVTADRQRKVNVSGALRERFALGSPAPSVEKPTVGGRLRRVFGLDHPVRRLAFGMALLLLLAGTVWLVLREPHIQRIVRRQARPTPVASPEVTHHGSEVSSPTVHTETSPPMLVHEPPVVVEVILAHGGTPASASLPQGERDILRFRLTLERNLPGIYRAELLTATGQSVSDATTLKPVDGKIDLEVPARLLKEGDYLIRVSRVDSRSEGATLFYFRVNK